MRLEDFDFDLPRELIADRPVEPHDTAQLVSLTTDAHAAGWFNAPTGEETGR